MSTVDVSALAEELLSAHSRGELVSVPPSARDGGLGIAAAYAVEAEIVRRRRETGRRTVGRKVGFANKAMWRILKLDTLVWARMYDDTVQHANSLTVSLEGRRSPKIEPEIVFKVKDPLGAAAEDAPATLKAVEWLALGFEINDCVFPDWKFQPVDFVAALGLHTRLIVGEPLRVGGDTMALADALAAFTVRLLKDGQLVEEGAGRNCLRSPALCLGELARSIARQPDAEPLTPGEIISSGTLTAPHPVSPGETWRAEVDGLALSPLTVRF